MWQRRKQRPLRLRNEAGGPQPLVEEAYAGHEFLDAARSNKLWQAAKTFLMNTTGALTLEGLKTALPVITKQLLQQ